MANYEHLLVPTDLSDESLAGVRSAASLARRLGARVTLLFVVDDRLPPLFDALPDGDRGRLLDDHRRKAAQVLEEMAGAHLDALEIESAVLEGTPHEEIVRAATTTGADLIVMATHGYGRVGSIVFGSTAERVLRHSPVPVVLVPATASRG